MLIILLTADASPQCFSLASYLQGDIQSRTLSLTLQPKLPIDPLCLALNGSFATAQLFFHKSTISPDFISKEFIYISGVTNIAEISISSLTLSQINALIKINAAQYIVKILKSAPISGSLETITYLKIDVSSCWSSQIYAFGSNFGDEMLEFRLTPNDCVIPQNAILTPQFTFRENGTKLTLAEFQTGTGTDDYKHPYIHSEVKLARLRCKEIADEVMRDQCYEIVKFVTNSQDYFIGVKLAYETNGIGTNVMQDADMYQALGSRLCAQSVNLATYVYPDGFFLYHDKFESFTDCIIADRTVYVELDGIITGSGVRIQYYKTYDIQEYKQHEYLNHIQDMQSIMQSSYSSYPKYIQFDKDNQISGSFYFSATVVKQCIYLANLIIVNDQTVDLEFRSHYFEVCQDIAEDFEFQLLSESSEILYQEQFSINITAIQAIQSRRFQLKSSISGVLRQHPGVEFTVRGASFYFAGKDINYSKDIIFLVIQFSYFLIYLSIGLLAVFVILKTQNRKD